jgi:hypothetical protein
MAARTRGRSRRLCAVLAVGAVLAAACGGDGSDASSNGNAPATSSTTAPPSSTAAPVITTPDNGAYAPSLDPANFVATIDNRYLPFTPGAKWTYDGTSDGEDEHIEVVVTSDRKEILGISATVVRDTVTTNGALVEDTFDWYAQDRDGNVWYLGEDTKEYEDGRVTSTKGSWEAGVDGAQAGIVMLADPKVGATYRQEYYIGEAEDLAEVMRVGESVTLASGSFDNVVVTREWTPLEPDIVEEKSYAPGVGLLLEQGVAGAETRIELTSHTP